MIHTLTALRTTTRLPICAACARLYGLTVRPARPDEPVTGCDFCINRIPVAAGQVGGGRTGCPTPSLDRALGDSAHGGDDETSDRIKAEV